MMGKGEISPFPTVFLKDFYCRHIKTKACLGKVKNVLKSCSPDFSIFSSI